MKKPHENEKRTFKAWLKKNPTRIGLLLFATILPIALVLTAYIGSYTANRSVYFDRNITEDSEKIKDFKTLDELTGLTLDLEWSTLKKPETNDEGELVLGYYQFKATYEQQSTYDIQTISITPVLKTDWKNVSYVGNKQSPNSRNEFTLKVDFNHKLPLRPLPFVKVNDPHLYLKIEYSYLSAGQTIMKTEYVKFTLTGLNPITVIRP